MSQIEKFWEHKERKKALKSGKKFLNWLITGSIQLLTFWNLVCLLKHFGLAKLTVRFWWIYEHPNFLFDFSLLTLVILTVILIFTTFGLLELTFLSFNVTLFHFLDRWWVVRPPSCSCFLFFDKFVGFQILFLNLFVCDSDNFVHGLLGCFIYFYICFFWTVIWNNFSLK